MARLVIHIKDGQTISAPFEVWCIALINSLPSNLQHEVFRQVSKMNGASIIPDKYTVFEDNLGTMQIVENPLIDLSRKLN
jgi:hypothetical protein